MRSQERNTELQKKVHRRTCVREITFLAARPHSYIIFRQFFHLLTPFRLFQFYIEKIIRPCLILMLTLFFDKLSRSIYFQSQYLKHLINVENSFKDDKNNTWV